MKALLMVVLLICASTPVASAQNADWARRLDAPPPKAARAIVKRGVDLAGRDRIDEAIATLKKAIAAAPNYLEAHREYIRARAYFKGEVNEVKAEYESLAAKEPDNPVYPMALAITVRGKNEMAWLRRVVELAPEWSWAHYANSYIIPGRTWKNVVNETYDGKGERMLAEAFKAIEKDGSTPDFYYRAVEIQEDLGKIDEALLTAEKMAAMPELRADGLGQLWRLRLKKAKGAEQSRESLKAELAKLSVGARDIRLLAAIREAYATFLKDQANADAVERRIRRLDPSWYPERGKARIEVVLNSSGAPYPILSANRQFVIHEKMRQIVMRREADWRKETRQLESLIALGPNLGLKKFIYLLLFSSARRAEEVEAMIKYGEQLGALDPGETAPLARIALAMANKKTDLLKALEYARRAEVSFAEFRPMSCPPDIPADDFESRFSLKKQRENHQRMQALALDAAGWVLCQLGQAMEAEPKLRRSVELNRTETALTHLAETLKQLGQSEEAEKIESEINNKMLESVKSQFINQPAKDFQLEATDGRKHRLSDLKGKVVLVNFWATWCAPCVAEMPLFARAYEKYKDQGFEVLAISSDDPADRELVSRFAKERRLNFPVLYDDRIAELYGVTAYPGNYFIDRQGAIRYVQSGGFDDGGRRLEIILRELLK
jgi:peroxiredoxin